MMEMHPQAEHPTDVTVQVASTFAQWRDIMSDRFVPLLITNARPNEQFEGRVVSRTFDEAHVSLVTSDAHTARRLPERINATDERYVKLSLQLRGQSTYTQDGKAATIGPGDLVIYDTSRPYSMDAHGAVESFVVMLRPASLTLSRSNLDRLTAVRLAPTSMVGECAEPFMRQFVRRFEQLSVQDGAHLIRAFFGLVDAVLHAELSTMAPPDTDFNRVRNYIERHLGDEDLTAARIARENFISLRSLQYLFQDRGTTVSNWIRRERLSRSRLDLANPALIGETIASIVTRSGFQSPASFSRAFRQEFGETPGEWRERAAASIGD